MDVEDPAVPFDQLCLDSQLLLDKSRQTGGPGIVVSDLAEFDGDLHGVPPPVTPLNL